MSGPDTAFTSLQTSDPRHVLQTFDPKGIRQIVVMSCSSYGAKVGGCGQAVPCYLKLGKWSSALFIDG